MKTSTVQCGIFFILEAAVCALYCIPSFLTVPYHHPPFSLNSRAVSKVGISSLLYSWNYLLAECGGSSSRGAKTKVLRLWRSLFPSFLCALCHSHLWNCCYYAIVSLLLSSGPIWIIPGGKHSKYVLHNMIWRTRIITLSPWASDQSSANPTEAWGACVGKGFSMTSLLTFTGRKSQKWALDMKLSGRCGALERLSLCVQPLAWTVVLRGCCAEIWDASPSPLLFQFGIARYHSILGGCATHSQHPQIVDGSGWNANFCTFSS